jgi:hypothetical protein
MFRWGRGSGLGLGFSRRLGANHLGLSTGALGLGALGLVTGELLANGSFPGFGLGPSAGLTRVIK